MIRLHTKIGMDSKSWCSMGWKLVLCCHLEVEGFEVHFMYIKVNSRVHGWLSWLEFVHMFSRVFYVSVLRKPKEIFFYFFIILCHLFFWNFCWVWGCVYLFWLASIPCTLVVSGYINRMCTISLQPRMWYSKPWF